MAVVLAVALLLITAAIVVLYAMVGELARRIPAGEPAADPVRRLTEFQEGTAPAYWPDELSALQDARRALLLVLSPVCSTCTSVAGQLAILAPEMLDIPVGVVVSAAHRAAGDQFVEQNSLARFRLLIDEGGT